jgi:hypothetical protein
VVPGAIIMALTLIVAVQPHLQGIILTVGTMGFFIVAMILIPKLKSLTAASTVNPLPPLTA